MNIDFEVEGSSANGCARVFISLFFGIFLAMGLVFTTLMASGFVQDFKASRWKKTKCTVIESRVESGNSENPYQAIIRFKYTFDGRGYTGDRLKFTDQGTEDYTEAQGTVLRYPKGISATCLVNPENPAEAILERGSFFAYLAIFFPLIFVAIGGVGLFFTWRQSNSSRPAKRSISQRVQGIDSKKFTFVMGVFFFLIGTVVFFLFFVSPMLELIDAQDWGKAPCTVIHAAVTTHSGDDGDTYSIDILYEFRFADVTLRSDRYDFSNWSSSGYEGKQRIVDAYPPGSQAWCFVDPENPHRAVLNRQFQAKYLIGLFPLIFSVVGLGLLLHSVKQKSSGFSRRQPPGPPIEYDPDFGISGERCDGPLVLKPTLSPFAKLAGITAICLFWNGIVSVFVWQLISQWRSSGDISWGLGLFLTPFILVGIGLLGGIFYFLLALANPRPILTLSTSTIRLGDTVPVEWRFTGRSSRIETLTITLEGLESATYRRGTDTHTDTEVFHRTIIVQSTQNYEIDRGNRQFTIPDDTMHSWKANNNKIIWKIKVKGDIPQWPDVNEEFEVRVLPQELKRP